MASTQDTPTERSAKRQRRIFENNDIRRDVSEETQLMSTFSKGICWHWNHRPEGCSRTPEECRYRHVCSRCSSVAHREIDCHVSFKGLSPNAIPLHPNSVTLLLQAHSDALKMPLVKKLNAYLSRLYPDLTVIRTTESSLFLHFTPSIDSSSLSNDSSSLSLDSSSLSNDSSSSSSSSLSNDSSSSSSLLVQTTSTHPLFSDLFLARYLATVMPLEHVCLADDFSASLVPGWSAAMKLRLRVYPQVSLNDEVARRLPPDTHYDPVDYTHLLNVAIFEGRYYFALHARDVADGYLRLARGCFAIPNAVSRAIYKLYEALRIAHVRLDRDATLAVDLGAAPGGWSQLLAESCREVVAIDPGALRIPHGEGTRVRHMPMLAEKAVQVLLAEGRGREAGLVVCDMNMLPRESLPVIREALPLLKPGGLLVYTLKLPSRTTATQDAGVERFVEQMKAEFPSMSKIEVYHLLSNRSERTVIATFD